MDVELRSAYDAVPAPVRRHLQVRRPPVARGISRRRLASTEWLRTAPSTELRRWYGHDVDLFDEFRRRHRDELSRPPAAELLAALAETAEGDGVLLLTATATSSTRAPSCWSRS